MSAAVHLTWDGQPFAAAGGRTARRRGADAAHFVRAERGAGRGQVGVAFPRGDVSQPGGLCADGGQVQLAGGGPDRCLGGGVGDGGHGALLVSSSS